MEFMMLTIILETHELHEPDEAIVKWLLTGIEGTAILSGYLDKIKTS
jgi:hypothetical protein